LFYFTGEIMVVDVRKIDKLEIDFTARMSKMVALLKQFVEIESPTHNKNAVNRFGEVVAREAQKLGAVIEVLPKSDVGD
jgi:glutamate carboxypeptidase